MKITEFGKVTEVMLVQEIIISYGNIPYAIRITNVLLYNHISTSAQSKNYSPLISSISMASFKKSFNG